MLVSKSIIVSCVHLFTNIVIVLYAKNLLKIMSKEICGLHVHILLRHETFAYNPKV